MSASPKDGSFFFLGGGSWGGFVGGIGVLRASRNASRSRGSMRYSRTGLYALSRPVFIHLRTVCTLIPSRSATFSRLRKCSSFMDLPRDAPGVHTYTVNIIHGIIGE